MMRRAWTVARREIRGYFDQPTAYVLIVAFLALSLFLAFREMYASSVASMRPLFDLLPILLAVFVPSVTMRSLAEERRSKTLEWVLAQPLTEAELVVGKFLGDWLFVVIAIAGTLPTAIGVLLVSSADPGIVTAQYIGAALLAAQFVALGLWASSFTRNQITAFIVAAMMSFVLFLIGLQVVQIGLPPAISGALARLSVVSHFQNVARGVIDLRDVLYFVSTGALFLVLAVGAIGRERLSHSRAEYRRLRTGAGVVALLVVVLNLLGSHVRGRLDLTKGDLYTLSDGTRDLLGGLDDLVQVKLFASAELPPEVQIQLRDVRDLLSDMRRASDGKLLVTELNPDKDQDAASEASDLGIGPIEFNVLRNDEFQVKRGYYGLAVEYADQHEVTPLIQSTDDLEFKLASQIYRMTTEKRPGVAFVDDFGAKSSYDIPGLDESLGQRYKVTSVHIAGDSVPPISTDSTTVLVIAGATQQFDTAAVRRVKDFIDAGGGALLLMEPATLDQQNPIPVPVHTGLEPILQAHGIGYTTSLVMDLASSERVSLGRRGLFNVIAPYPLWPIVQPAGKSAMTSGLNSMTLGWASEMKIENDSIATPLWQTSDAGAIRDAGLPITPDQDWNVPDEDLAVRTVAAAVTPPEGQKGGRLVVVDDGTFVEPQFVQSNPANLTFVANAIDWLAQDESLIRIRSKDRTPPSLVFGSDASKNFLKWGNLVGMPLLFAFFGVARVTGRRRRAEARWKEVVS